MRLHPLNRIRRVLLTVDAVGGVWPYALDMAEMLAGLGIMCRLLGFGPPPPMQWIEAAGSGIDLVWMDEPLDWMVRDEQALDQVSAAIMEQIQLWRPDVVHLAALSQASGLPPGPVVVAHAHSCVPTWWDAVRGDRLPEYWAWQWHRNRSGLDRADRVIVPARSHGVLLDRVYGAVSRVSVVPNAARRATEGAMPEQSYVFAAGRWWDDGKNGRVLDQAAADLPLPVLMAGALTGPNGASLDLSHAISLGQLTPMQTGTHMAQAAIFAAPSLYEPFGLAVLEAASRGATLLLADIPTFRELWNDCAIFVNPRDAAAWSGAIMALMADDDRRAALGGRARMRAAALSFQHQWTTLLPAYVAAMRNVEALA